MSSITARTQTECSNELYSQMQQQFAQSLDIETSVRT